MSVCEVWELTGWNASERIVRCCIGVLRGAGQTIPNVAVTGYAVVVFWSHEHTDTLYRAHAEQGIMNSEIIACFAILSCVFSDLQDDGQQVLIDKAQERQ